jgi:transposase-like protein
MLYGYLRFTLSYRDVEKLLIERGLDISYERVRSWVLKFGPMIARRLRQVSPRPSDRWHLDEMIVRIAGKRMYLFNLQGHLVSRSINVFRNAKSKSRSALESPKAGGVTAPPR